MLFRSPKYLPASSESFLKTCAATSSGEKQRALDATMESEGTKDFSPMVQISIKEYDKLKEQQKFITDPSLISIVDKIEELVRALRKHIVRTEL